MFAYVNNFFSVKENKEQKIAGIIVAITALQAKIGLLDTVLQPLNLRSFKDIADMDETQRHMLENATLMSDISHKSANIAQLTLAIPSLSESAKYLDGQVIKFKADATTDNTLSAEVEKAEDLIYQCLLKIDEFKHKLAELSSLNNVPNQFTM